MIQQSGKNKDTSGVVGRALQRPNHRLGKSIKVGVFHSSDSARAVERAPQRPCCSVGQSSEVFGEKPLCHRPLTANFTKSLELTISFDTDRHGPEDVGQTAGRRCLALFGSVGSGCLGQCASAHSLQALECSREVWAEW